MRYTDLLAFKATVCATINFMCISIREYMGCFAMQKEGQNRASKIGLMHKELQARAG